MEPCIGDMAVGWSALLADNFWISDHHFLDQLGGRPEDY
jgi:hypothetical protein